MDALITVCWKNESITCRQLVPSIGSHISIKEAEEKEIISGRVIDVRHSWDLEYKGDMAHVFVIINPDIGFVDASNVWGIIQMGD